MSFERDFFFHAYRRTITVHEDLSIKFEQAIFRTFFPLPKLKIDVGPSLKLGIYSTYDSFKPPGISPALNLKGEYSHRGYSYRGKGSFSYRFRKTREFEEKTKEIVFSFSIGFPSLGK